MALSLLAGYSSPESGDSDSDDDGIKVVIHKNQTGHHQHHTKNNATPRGPVYGGGRKRTLESRTAASRAPSSVMNPVMKRRKAKAAAGGESVLRRSNTLEEELVDSSIPLPSTGLKESHLYSIKKKLFSTHGLSTDSFCTQM